MPGSSFLTSLQSMAHEGITQAGCESEAAPLVADMARHGRRWGPSTSRGVSDVEAQPDRRARREGCRGREGGAYRPRPRGLGRATKRSVTFIVFAVPLALVAIA